MRPVRLLVSFCALSLLGVAVLGAGTPGRVGAAPAADNWVPVFDHDFPDPDVLVDDGVYYAYSTQQLQTGVPVPGATSADGLAWSTSATDIVPRLPYWATPGNTWSPTVASTSSGLS